MLASKNKFCQTTRCCVSRHCTDPVKLKSPWRWGRLTRLLMVWFRLHKPFSSGQNASTKPLHWWVWFVVQIGFFCWSGGWNRISSRFAYQHIPASFLRILLYFCFISTQHQHSWTQCCHVRGIIVHMHQQYSSTCKCNSQSVAALCIFSC